MRVANQTSFPLVAFGWHEKRGYGPETTIPPGEVKNFFGPYLGEMGGEPCWIAIPGGLVCQEAANQEGRFQVVKGRHLCLKMGEVGFSIRHHEDPRDIDDEHYRANLAAGPVEKIPEFPFGIDPGQPLYISGRVHIEVEGYGANTFTDPEESVVSLANQVIAMNTGEIVRVDDARNYLTVVGWDEKTGHMKVKLNK